MKAVALLFVALFLSACSVPLRKNVTMTDSPYEARIAYVGIERVVAENGPFLVTKALIRSWVDRKTKAVTHQIYVEDRYRGDWKFWNRATGFEGKVLTFTSISRDVESCVYSPCILSETFGVAIPDEAMQQSKNGFSFQASARDGSRLIVTVDAEMVQRQLAAINGETAPIIAAPSPQTNAPRASKEPEAQCLMRGGGVRIMTPTACREGGNTPHLGP